MKEIEQELIDNIKLLQQNKYGYGSRAIGLSISKLCQELFNTAFGESSLEFLNDPSVKSYVEHDAFPAFRFWILIENYLVNSNDDALEKGNFELLTNKLKDPKDLYYRQALANPILVRNVYLSKNDKLINLFKQLLPIPKSELFYGYELPPSIAEQERKKAEILLRNPVKEETIIKAQRRFRGKRRQIEEKNRVTTLVSNEDGAAAHYFQNVSGKETVEQLLDEANTPYRPQGCDAKLADRIVEAAKKVNLFSNIKHLTSAKALPSILNDGLYGRKTLEKFNMNYKGASLMPCDIKDGDFNVICFGPQEIDPKSIQSDSIEFTLDLDKVQKDNPCIFYKQRDLGYALDKKRTILLGGKPLIFSHTGTLRAGNPTECTNLKLFASNGQIDAYSELPKFLFIAYDLQNMHQILTLNFFRFLDTLEDLHSSNCKSNIYKRIAALDDNALVEFLQELGKNFTDTAEFNFYGSHRLDFSSIQTIKSKIYTIELPSFIKELQTGNLDKLREAQAEIPQLFKSYRFVDFLLSQVTNEKVKSELQTYRKDCQLPFWLDAKEKGLTEQEDLTLHQQTYVKASIEKREQETARKIREKIERKTQDEIDRKRREEERAAQAQKEAERKAQEEIDRIREEEKRVTQTQKEAERKAQEEIDRNRDEAERLAQAQKEIEENERKKQEEVKPKKLADETKNNQAVKIETPEIKSLAKKQKPASSNQQFKFYKSETERLPLPSQQIIQEQVLAGHLTKNKHANDIVGLKFLLEKYIARIENNIGDQTQAINYKANFNVLIKEQAANRKANYYLARELRAELDKLPENDSHGLQGLFSKENLAKLRKNGHSYFLFGDKVRSKELDSIIEDARKIQANWPKP